MGKEGVPKRSEDEGGPGRISNGDLAKNLRNTFQASQETKENARARTRAESAIKIWISEVLDNKAVYDDESTL